MSFLGESWGRAANREQGYESAEDKYITKFKKLESVMKGVQQASDLPEKDKELLQSLYEDVVNSIAKYASAVSDYRYKKEEFSKESIHRKDFEMIDTDRRQSHESYMMNVKILTRNAKERGFDIDVFNDIINDRNAMRDFALAAMTYIGNSSSFFRKN